MVCIPPLDIINVYAKSSPGNYNSFGQISPCSVSVNKYDTIQVDNGILHALERRRYGHLNLANSTEMKNKEKLKTKTEQLKRNGPSNSP